MKKNAIMEWKKRLIVGTLATALVLGNVLMTPGMAKATETTDPATRTVVYEQKTADEFAAWKTNRVTPEKEGYFFGGWYVTENGKPLKETEIEGYSNIVYAKFVPDYVLSVKAQADAGATKKDDGMPANVRILTSLDSLDYQRVGVKVLLANKNDTGINETTKVYDELVINAGTENEATTTASEVFGTASNYFGVWKISNIEDKYDGKIIYVRPYWVTMDGTTVYGLAKYVHVEDAYLQYISIPINLLSGTETAAGIVSMQYDADNLEFVEVEKGRVLNDEMEYSCADGTLKIVGNEKDVNIYAGAGESIFANVRFKVKDSTAIYNTNDSGETTRNLFLDFTINGTSFSNWNEEVVDAGAWDIRY